MLRHCPPHHATFSILPCDIITRTDWDDTIPAKRLLICRGEGLLKAPGSSWEPLAFFPQGRHFLPTARKYEVEPLLQRCEAAIASTPRKSGESQEMRMLHLRCEQLQLIHLLLIHY